MTFELSQFQTVRREGIQLTLRRVLKIDATLGLASVSERVHVVATAPVVDVKSTALGTSFSKELLPGIPNARDLWSTMALAPGFSMSGVDVGGSHTGSQTRFVSYGVLGGSRTLVEGIISNNNRTGNSGYFDYGSLQEYETSGSGAMGEAAGPGSLLNFAVKAGTDAFHWGALGNYQNHSMRSNNTPDALSTPGAKDENGFFAPPAGIGDSNSIVSMYDANGDLGRPIVRGKARFYVSFRDNNYYSTVAGLPGVETQSRLSNATFKVNYSLNPRNTLIGFYTWRYKLDSERDLSAAVPPESTRNQVGLMHLGKVEWTSILTDRLFLDFQAGTHIASNEYTSPLNKSRDTTGLPVGRQDLVTGQFSGTNPSLAYNPDSRPQLTGSLSWSPAAKLWGAHFVKLGFQIHTFSAGGEPFMAGDIFYYDRNGVPAEVQIYNTPLTSANTNRNIGIYLQDAWNVGTRVTLNVGVRYDNYALGWPAASNTPNQTAFFQPVSGPASTPVTWNSIGPRLGVVWDVGGDSRTVIKAFAGNEQGFRWDPNRRLFGKSDTSFWNFKVVARYTTPFWGISVAPTYRLMSGYNWVRRPCSMPARSTRTRSSLASSPSRDRSAQVPRRRRYARSSFGRRSDEPHALELRPVSANAPRMSLATPAQQP